MTDENSFPQLPRPVRLLVRILVALFRLIILTPFRIGLFMCCIVGGVFARKDINTYKINSLFALVLNLIGKVI